MRRVSLAFLSSIMALAAHAATTTPPRSGSVLDSGKLLPAPTDLRGEAELLRDAELTTHFSRLATFDVIASLASRQKHLELAEKVEQVRRKEVQRHQRAMIAARSSTLAVGPPPKITSDRAGAAVSAPPAPEELTLLPDSVPVGVPFAASVPAALAEVTQAGPAPTKRIYRAAFERARKTITADNASDELRALARQIDKERQNYP